MKNGKTALILLAAGDGRRFGENKLEYELNGKKMYRYPVEEMKKLPPDFFCCRIIVSQYDSIMRETADDGYMIIRNENSALGISHSLKLGLACAVQSGADSACFMVCDQPYLTAESVKRLILSWRESGKKIGCLGWKSRPGNPVVFSEECFEELEKLSGDMGGRRMVKRYPQDVYLCEAGKQRELDDIDTTDALP